MSVYQKIFAATSRRAAASSAITSQKLFAKAPQALWAIPAGTAATWFIFGALTDEIKQSVGLYYDPHTDVKIVEMERAKRIEAKEAEKAAKVAAKGGNDDDEDEDEDGEEEEDDAVSAAVSKAVASAMTDDDDDDDDEEVSEEEEATAAAASSPDVDDDEEEEEEEEESPKAPKKPKIKPEDMSLEDRWDDFLDKAIKPGEDDDEDDEDDDDDDDEDDEDDDVSSSLITI